MTSTIRLPRLLPATFLILLFAKSRAHSIPKPNCTGTPEQYARAIQRIESFIASTTNDKDTRLNAQALYYFHSPEEPVHGTVMVFHGGFGKPSMSNLTAEYLFENRFNVYSPPLAGHAYQGNRWPYTILRPDKGGREARNALLNDGVIGEIVKGINNGSLMAPVHGPNGFNMDIIIARALQVLKEKLSYKQYNDVMTAMSLLVREDYYPGLEMDMYEFFESDHFMYDSQPYDRFSDVASLPGPKYAVGYSMGAVQSMYLAARAKSLDRIVLMAPFVEPAAPKDKPEYRYLLEAVGVFDLYNAPVEGDTAIPSRILPAADLAGRFLLQEDILRPIRDNTATFCIMAEDDGMADFELGFQTCRDRVRNERSVAYAYPAEEKLNHFVAPGQLNRLSIPVLQETLRFLTTGSVHSENMLKPQGDPDMPRVSMK